MPPRTKTASRAAAGGSAPLAKSGGRVRQARRPRFHPRFSRDNGKGRAMNAPLARFARLLMLAILLAVSAIQPAAAQDGSVQVLRDTETELLFRQASEPLIEAAGLDPKSVKVVLLNDPEINAFVAQRSDRLSPVGPDLIAADNVNQVQGVIAHELGHVAGGHSIRMRRGHEGRRPGSRIATLVLGALAMAAGAGEAGMGIMPAGQQVAMGSFLAFTRAQEASRRPGRRQISPRRRH